MATFSVALGELFKDLISPLVQRFLFGDDVPQLLEDMRGVLLTVKAVLDDAEEKQIISPSVTNWVNELKDAAYQVEDLLDETETKRLELELIAQNMFKGKTMIEIEKQKERFQVTKENLLKEMVEKLKNLAGARDLLNLKASVRQKPPTMYPTTSLPDEYEVIGRDKDIKELKSLLAGNAQQNKIQVIAIVGLGGVGKTRIAQLLWEEVQKEEFQLKAWAYVSKGSDVVDVTVTILQSFNLFKSEVRDLNILQLGLVKTLKGQKFLLVLDNIWDDDYLNCWELLSRPLRAGKSGSRIIVTTRNQNVASKMGADVTYPLLPLSFEACWSLFEKHAFQGNPRDYPGLKTIGEKIVKKCDGLPLAAKTLGGILRPKLEDEEWRKILDSKIWDVAYSNILPALVLSYYDLPGHLKKCFAYCSIFPKGYKIEKYKLVLLWMAQGFLEQTNGSDTMEKVGEEYGCELLSRSLFQSSGNGLCFVMHDLINDLAQFASGKFCCKFENGKTHANWEKARHFAFLMKKYDGPETFVDIITTATPLRTLLPVSFLNPSTHSSLDPTSMKELLKKMKWLRVLSFSRYGIYTLPESLGKLIHLRYLDFSHMLIANLPESTCSLYNLQTLLLSSCPNLTALPAKIGDLTNLRHLDVSETKLTEIPIGIERLTSLQVLINFVVSTGSGSKMGELFELSHLRMLSISSMERVVDAKNASNADLGSKRHLEELGLKWNSDTGVQSAPEVFQNLRPHKNLKKLTVENYGGTAFPNWLGDAVFSNMVSLTLLDCKDCVSLPSLGKLSSLQELHIKNMARLERLGNEFYGNNNFESRPFKSLKTLRFENLQQWVHWESFRSEGEAFPSLQELHIKKCPQLIGSIPAQLRSLMKLKVFHCERLQTLSTGLYTLLNYFQVEGCQSLLSLSIQESHTCLPCLQKLKLSDCPSLSQFSKRNFSPNLKSLIITNCKNLTPQEDWGLLQMKWLTHFEIEGGCSNMLSFPEEKLLPITLNSLRISNLPDLRSLGLGLKHLTSLEKLIINRCENLEVAGNLPSNLQSLTIMNCNNLTLSTNWELNKMKSLFTFEIDGGCGSMNSFPGEDLLPPNLTSLQISNLPNLHVLGNGLHQLIWLANLKINNCEKLSMPAEKLPASLDSLDIQNCSKLFKDYEADKDNGWHRISHITSLYIPQLELPKKGLFFDFFFSRSDSINCIL